MSARSTPAARGEDGGWLFAAVVVLIALNLRAFLTASSPLLAPIREATGIGLQAVALLTVLPMAAMGAVSLFGAAVGQRIGAWAGVALGLAAIGIACASRAGAGGAGVLLASAALAGAGVGLVQALVPGVIKAAYPARLGVMTGLYAAAIMGGGGLAALASPWIAQALGDVRPAWRAGLSVWALLAALALVGWWMLRRRVPEGGRRANGDPLTDGTGDSRRALPADRAAHVDESSATAPTRGGLGWTRCFTSPRAWLLAICFGLINGGYTSLVAWLPNFYAEQGWSAQAGGSVLALMTAAQVLAALVLPPLARRRGRDLRPWLLLTLGAQLAGFGVLAAALPVPAVVVAAVLGLGLGGCFALSMVLALDHLPDPAQAGALAAFMQGVGFMIAALAPFETGWVRAQTGSFAWAWGYLAAVVVALVPLVWRFDPRGYAAATAGLFAAQASAPDAGARSGS